MKIEASAKGKSMKDGNPKNTDSKRTNKKQFEFLDIAPADAAFLAYGKDLSEVFANAALAVMDIIVDVGKVEAKDQRTVGAVGYDLRALMFDWLNELIFAIATENVIFGKFDVKVEELPDSQKDEKYKLTATCYGEKIDFQRHGFKAEAKAITYHLMDIKKDAKGWSAKVVVDL
jgi:SHS2 domain-containing protein